MTDFGDKVVFQIAELTKTRRPGKPYQTVTLVEYQGDKKLDVLACLRVYLRRTASLRKTEAQKQKLLIACVKPHKPVAPCSVGRWLKIVMEKAGIDIDKYKAHSVRGASTSKASRSGLSTKQIIERANWSKAKTFFMFYNRNVSKPDDKYQDAVLSMD